MKIWNNLYNDLTTIEAILSGFEKFKKGKRKTPELLTFEKETNDNLSIFQNTLKNKTYSPGKYIKFYINDPKVRLIHKATLRDRIVHHVLSVGLEQIFEPIFIANSFACRKNKGTHKGVQKLAELTRKVSRNNTRACFALKCDIRKFFASIDHTILYNLLTKKIADRDYLSILKKIIDSFQTDGEKNKGLPIGNLTSQYFGNIYMNELDQFIKHKLKIKYYLRYTDDFIILSPDKKYLEELLPEIVDFLKTKLELELHPDKIKFTTLAHGIDFLGYVVYPHHVLPRTKTKKRIFKKALKKPERQTIASYLGYLSHANAFRLQKKLILNTFSELGPLDAKKLGALKIVRKKK